MEKINRRWYNKFIKKKEDVKMSVLNIDNTNFEAEVLNSSKKVLVDFWASWCGPCKRLAPVLEELAQEYDGEIYIYKVNTEEERELAAAFGIRSIPTLLFCPMEGRAQIAQGALPKDILKQAIDDVLLGKKTEEETATEVKE